MATFKVINLGCKVNRAESDSVELALASKGMLQSDEDCDIVVINTCTVTSVAEKKTRKTVRHALSSNPKAKVVVTGCAVAQDSSVYESMSDRVDAVLKWDLKSYLDNLDFESVEPEPIHSSFKDEKEVYCRANVKVQDGCINECSYCIIRKLRGPELSISPAEVLSRSSQLAKNGIVEIILSGINLGRYDFEGAKLADLCEYLLRHEKSCRYRLSSIEPNNMSDEIIEKVSNSNGRICRHFHMPLQSGCDKTLASMNRKYTTNDYLDVVEKIKESMPMASISTDVICGFPGESNQDFEETMDFCEKIGFSKIHVFPYSPRRGTPAASMQGQIDHSTKLERARNLRDLAEKLRDEDLRKRRGTKEFAVVEDEKWCMSESYHRVLAPEGEIPGKLVEVIL